MAVNVLPESLSSKAASAPAVNKRLPPLADRSSLSYKLTNLSKQKLAREATAPDPDIRRCLGHFRMHCMSVEFAQQEMATKITSFEFEDDSESEDEEAQTPAKEQKEIESSATTTTITVTPAPTPVEPEVQVEVVESPAKDTEQDTQVHLEVISDEKDKDPGLVDKSRRCLEKAQIWPSPAQCMPVRIAS